MTNEMTPAMLKELISNDQRAATRNKNVNRHIRICNAIVKQASGRRIIGRKLEEWNAHNAAAQRLIEKYTKNPIR